ncbi:MAG TPA: 16S rRNA (uracil(1498)-N(3))-methyltransferase [Rhodocyclaceae bacterium]|nr:16S rRNA (uracil(1498)-N(3))-methyltransferase [Rhodocyclaceae bacterium]
MTPRFYCPTLADISSTCANGMPLADGKEISLPSDAAHHADRVLRLRPGDAVVVFDGRGGEFLGKITATGRQVRVSLHERIDTNREPQFDVVLVQALAVADKMDWVVQKASEAGARAVQPVMAERSVLRLEGERAAKRVAHWRQVAVAAAEQCGRNRVMEVGEISGSLNAWLAQPFEGLRWLLDPDEGMPLTKQTRPAGAVAVLIGPEGGWSPAEIATARAAGCAPITMGPRVLRTETVGVAVTAAMMALWGDY